MDNLDDDPPKRASKATIIRRVLVGLLALACAVGWIYTRYLVKKEGLGGPCSYEMHCRPESPRCLKQSIDADGVCSRPCDTDADCAPDIRCVKVELDETDERGRPLQGGYCFPQSLLDERRKRRKGDAGAPARSDSWIDVPEAGGQLEGELTVERSGAKATYEVKGTLVRAASKHGRTVVDTATLRTYAVDDEKKTFAAAQIATNPGEPKVTKTERKDRVADRDCEIWRLDEGSVVREACVVKGGALVDPGARAVAAWEKELTVRGVLPLRVTEGDKVRLLVTKLEAKPLERARFAIPKSYRNLAGR